MKPAIEYIRQHPDIIGCRNEIDAAIGEVRADFFDQIANGIMERLRPEFRVNLRPSLQHNRFGKDANGALIIKAPPSSPLARFDIWVEHIAKYQDALVVGIETKYGKPPLSATDELLLQRMEQLLVQ